MTRRGVVALLAALVLGAAAASAAEPLRIRIARAPGLAFMPIYVVQHERLIERRLAAAGITDTAIEYREVISGNDMNAALLAGDLDIACGGVPPFLILWARALGTPQEVRAIAAVSALQSVLLTRSPTVNTIRDFTERDRIAVAAVRASQVAILLQMAAVQTFGEGQHAKLDALTVSLPQPESLTALLSGRTEITAHFTVPPYSYLEAKAPGIRAVLRSRDVLGGVGTVIVGYATARLRARHPAVVPALLGALEDAGRLIRDDPERAAAVYLAMAKEPISAAELATLLRDPDLSYDVAPAATGKFSDFMFKIGSVPRRPERWQDLFFPEAHGLPGS
ncbi:MAG: ABC transporter substrate-binding protein [Proteobacteria bacterium]|nr:ABC transporter substrate-binding protein [Pseudomonadota bacterium]